MCSGGGGNDCMDSYNTFSSNDDCVSPSIKSALQVLPLKVLTCSTTEIMIHYLWRLIL